MNYIDITQPNQTLKLNINDNGLNEVEFEIFKDGNDDPVYLFYANDIIDFKYYQQITIPAFIIPYLEDETQYTLLGKETVNFKVVYRGKFQTTSKDLNNLSVNEGQYIKKTTATNYTILD